MALVSVLLTACAGEVEQNNDAPFWDPCTAFPVAAMERLEFDYKSSVELAESECAWVNTRTGVSLNVQYGKTPARAKGEGSESVSLSEVVIGPYSGYHYRSKGVDTNFVCSVRLDTLNSYVVFRVYTHNYGSDIDPCPIATRAATDLNRFLPPPA